MLTLYHPSIHPKCIKEDVWNMFHFTPERQTNNTVFNTCKEHVYKWSANHAPKSVLSLAYESKEPNKRAAQEKQGYFGVIYTVLRVLEKALVQYKWRAQWAQCPGPFPRVPISRICSLRGPSKWTRGPLRKSIRRGKKKKVVKAECWLCCIHASTPTTTRFLVVLVSPSSVRYLIR